MFEHSQEYQRIQYRFWDAVETFDPEAIVVSERKNICYDAN